MQVFRSSRPTARGSLWARTLTLRMYVVVLAVTLVLVPLLVFWAWPHSKAMQNELDEVHDRHLLIARNISAALQRYHRDATTTFDFAADGLVTEAHVPLGGELLANLRFKSICMVDVASGRLIAGHSGTGKCPELASEESLASFRAIAVDNKTVVSGVHPGITGQPLVCFVRLVGDRMVIGAMDTDYFVELARAITFGVKGHAVIVDQTGKVLAHPIPAWEKSMRDISKVPVVQRMLSGQRGVETFFSPAYGEDMIAGFTNVPGAGWGVMVPQPLSELRQSANGVQRSALLVFSFGLLVATLVGCTLAWLLARPLNNVIKAARRMARGEPGVRIQVRSRFLPSELRTLIASFNVMSARVSHFNERLEQRVAERTAVAEQALEETRIANERLLAEAKERSRAETDLRASNAALLSATQAKSQFLATMSHEIRTPMNGVLGMLERLARSELSERQHTHCAAARRSAEALLVVLNDILDYSRLEGSRAGLDETSFNLGTLLDDVVAMFAPAAHDKSIDLSATIPAESPQWLHGDPARLRQVVMKLVGNAVKFTPSGSVRVAASTQELTDGNVLVRIEVADTGIGIAAVDQARLFSSFTQGDASLDRKFGGAGLGLAISKQAVELMGGKITLDSEVGRGSTFRVELTLAPARAPADATVSQRDEAAAAAPIALRILVVEDNPVNQLVAEQTLLDAGHDVEIVENGREAVAAVGRNGFDLVLMDIQMPEMDGITATRVIRASQEPGRSLPIIAVTANASRQECEEYVAAGMDDVVAKPFSDKLLHASIARVIGHRRMAQAEIAKGERQAA